MWVGVLCLMAQKSPASKDCAIISCMHSIQTFSLLKTSLCFFSHKHKDTSPTKSTIHAIVVDFGISYNHWGYRAIPVNSSRMPYTCTKPIGTAVKLKLIVSSPMQFSKTPFWHQLSGGNSASDYPEFERIVPSSSIFGGWKSSYFIFEGTEWKKKVYWKMDFEEIETKKGVLEGEKVFWRIGLEMP